MLTVSTSTNAACYSDDDAPAVGPRAWHPNSVSTSPDLIRSSWDCSWFAPLISFAWSWWWTDSSWLHAARGSMESRPRNLSSDPGQNPRPFVPSCQHGQKLVRRYLNRGDQRAIHSQIVGKHTKIFNWFYLLGSDTMMKFECSKLLRSTKANTDYVFLMYRLSRNMTEPFRSRAQNQLRLILQFRGVDIPPSNSPLRLLIVSDYMELQIKEWMTGFILHHQVHFPLLFHKPRSPILGITGQTLGSYLRNFQTKLRWWQPTSQVRCTSQLFPDYVRQQD